MTIFLCQDSFEGVLSAVYDAWASRIPHEELRIQVGPMEQMEFFAQYVEVKEDTLKAQKVMRSISRKISYEAYRQSMNCALCGEKDRGDVLYRFLLYGFTHGAKITKYLQIPAVMQLFEYSRKYGNEAHYYREFVRFCKLGNDIYLSHISPTGDVLSMVANHFSDRMPSENFMIVDDNRKKAVIHPKDQDYYMRNLQEEEWLFLKEQEKKEDEYSDLWKMFFHTIAIKERENPTCQRNHLPLHFRKHMLEFS